MNICFELLTRFDCYLPKVGLIFNIARNQMVLVVQQCSIELCLYFLAVENIEMNKSPQNW